MPFFASYLDLVLNKSDGIPLLGLFKVFMKLGPTMKYQLVFFFGECNIWIRVRPMGIPVKSIKVTGSWMSLNCIWQSDTHYKITSLIKCNIRQVCVDCLEH